MVGLTAADSFAALAPRARVMMMPSFVSRTYWVPASSVTVPDVSVA